MEQRERVDSICLVFLFRGKHRILAICGVGGDVVWVGCGMGGMWLVRLGLVWLGLVWLGLVWVGMGRVDMGRVGMGRVTARTALLCCTAAHSHASTGGPSDGRAEVTFDPGACRPEQKG